MTHDLVSKVKTLGKRRGPRVDLVELLGLVAELRKELDALKEVVHAISPSFASR